MKKNILNASISLVVSLVSTYYLFQQQWGQDCLGCGLAPDGKTWLGPYMSDYISYSILGIFIFVFVFLILYIMLKFIDKLSK